MMTPTRSASDAAAVRAIYQPYVTETAILRLMCRLPRNSGRITKTLTNFLLFAAEVDGKSWGVPMFDLLCTRCL